MSKQIKAATILASSSSKIAHKRARVERRLGLAEGTIKRWMKNPEFFELINQKVDEIALRERPKVIKALIRRAKRGSLTHTRLYLDWLGDMARTRHPKKPEKVPESPLTEERPEKGEIESLMRQINNKRRA